MTPPDTFRDRLPWSVEDDPDLKEISYPEILADRVSGMLMEFGVAYGGSLYKISSAVNETVYGFDSFKGLPEKWASHNKGSFAIPDYRERNWHKNTELVVGMFQDTLPQFLAEHPGPVSYAHLDADLYTSTKFVLDQIASRIVVGTILHFDEIKKYRPGSEEEIQAFNEYLANGSEWQILGNVHHYDAAFRRIA